MFNSMNHYWYSLTACPWNLAAFFMLLALGVVLLALSKVNKERKESLEQLGSVLTDVKIAQPIPFLFHRLEGIYNGRTTVVELVAVGKKYGGGKEDIRIYLLPKVSYRKQPFWDAFQASKVKPTETTELWQNKLYYDVNMKFVRDITAKDFEDILKELTKSYCQMLWFGI